MPISASPETPALTVTQIGADFDEVASSIWSSSGLAVGVNRDTAYLNWRYSKPAITYFKFLANASEGLLVLKLYQDSHAQTLHICELIASQDKRRNVTEMLKFCELFGRQNEASTVTAWLPQAHPYARAFDEFGLEIVPSSNRYMFVYPGRRPARELTDQNLWHLSQGDSDIY